MISIHAPRVGGDYTTTPPHQMQLGFQFTPPVWGATVSNQLGTFVRPFQSTPPMRGATVMQLRDDNLVDISIHAPRAGGRLLQQLQKRVPRLISIHAPMRGATSPLMW